MNLITSFIAGLRPEPRLTVTQWAEKYRILSSKGAAEEGPYRVARTPYLRKIMDALSFMSGILKIIFMKGAQIGATEIGFNFIGYVVDMVPCPIVYVMPTLQTMERNVKQRIDPMFQECPTLLKKVGKKRSKDGGNTLAQKDFTGGTLICLGANSAAGLSSFPVRGAVLDEVDRYPGDVEGEGNPISLVEMRQATYGENKKTFIPSTPTIEGSSRIETEYNLTEQQYYYVPCPHCVTHKQLEELRYRSLLTPSHHYSVKHGYMSTLLPRAIEDIPGMQILNHHHLHWTKGHYHPEDVYYECQHCHGRIYNHHKTFMLAHGHWVLTNPANFNPEVMGFHLSALYSPEGWFSWSQVARAVDEAENDEPKLKTVHNTIFGLSFKVKGEAPPWQQLFDRAQSAGLTRNIVWSDVAFLTAGVDVQTDRLEVNIIGWMRGRSSQQIDYRILEGDTSKDEVWLQLGEILNETWHSDSGGNSPQGENSPFEGGNGDVQPTRNSPQGENSPFEGGKGDVKGNSPFEGGKGDVYQIRLMAIDSQFNSNKVHDFCKLHGTNRAIPTQGRDTLDMPFTNPKAVSKTKLGKNAGKLKVWGIGVSYLKTQLYGWLKLQIPIDGENAGIIPRGYCHLLPHEGHWFRGLCAEELTPVVNSKTNAIKHAWIKRYERNEPLDTTIYALAAAYILGFDRWSDRRWEKELKKNKSTAIITKARTNTQPTTPSTDDHTSDHEVNTADDTDHDQRKHLKDTPSTPKPKKPRRSKGGFW